MDNNFVYDDIKVSCLHVDVDSSGLSRIIISMIAKVIVSDMKFIKKNIMLKHYVNDLWIYL